MIVALTLAYPPSANRLYRHPSKGPLAGRHLISEAGRRYHKSVWGDVRDQLGKEVKLLPLAGRLAVYICVLPPDSRQRDLDNVAKAILDALQRGGVMVNDAQVDRLSLYREKPLRPGGAVFVRVEQLG